MGTAITDDFKKLRFFRLDSSENEIGLFKRDNSVVNIEEARKAVAEK